MNLKSCALAGLWISVFWFSGCAGWRWTPPAPEAAAVPGVSAFTGTFTAQELSALYYYDLGPDTIDISKYPSEQRRNYAVFARSCSQCHTLARPINSPRSSYWAWKYYVFHMRLRSEFSNRPGITTEEAERILDFLTYDSLIRKGENREDFEETTRRLHSRFNQILDERVRRTMQGMPPPHRDIP